MADAFIKEMEAFDDDKVSLHSLYTSLLGDIRIWVGPSSKHLLSSWDLTRCQRIWYVHDSQILILTSACR